MQKGSLFVCFLLLTKTSERHMERIRDYLEIRNFARDWKELDKKPFKYYNVLHLRKVYIYLVCLILQEVN